MHKKTKFFIWLLNKLSSKRRLRPSRDGGSPEYDLARVLRDRYACDFGSRMNKSPYLPILQQDVMLRWLGAVMKMPPSEDTVRVEDKLSSCSMEDEFSSGSVEDEFSTADTLSIRAPFALMSGTNHDSRVSNAGDTASAGVNDDGNDPDTDNDDEQDYDEDEERMLKIEKIIGHKFTDSGIDIIAVIEGENNNKICVSAVELQRKIPEMLFSYWESKGTRNPDENMKDMYYIFRIQDDRTNSRGGPEVRVEWLCYDKLTWEPCDVIRETASSVVDEYFVEKGKHEARIDPGKVAASGMVKKTREKRRRRSIANSPKKKSWKERTARLSSISPRASTLRRRKGVEPKRYDLRVGEQLLQGI